MPSLPLENISAYADGEHKLTIGLKELGQDNNLGDLFVTLKGENDGDSNIRSIHSLYRRKIFRG